MSAGVIISISIVVVSILMLVIVGFVSYNQIKPTMANVKDLNELLDQKKNYYTRESQHLNERVTLLNTRVELLQEEAEIKSVSFKDFSNEQGQFQTSIRYLQGHATDYAKGISTNVKDEIKQDGPKIKETFKRAFKKTFQKQKARHQN